MKASIFTILVLSIFFFSACEEKTTSSIPAPENTRVTGKITNPNASNQPTNMPGVEVESSTRIADPEYDDATVNYETLAKSICECAYESDKLNIEMQNLAASKKAKEFAAMAPKVDAAFKKSIKCSKEKTDALGTEFSPFNLVRSLKTECGELDADLVAQILRGLGVPI